MEKQKKYKVYDLCEGKETLGYADNMTEIKAIAKERYDDTDGECQIWYAPLSIVTGKYNIAKIEMLEVL
jgi:hypothetical protein